MKSFLSDLESLGFNDYEEMTILKDINIKLNPSVYDEENVDKFIIEQGALCPVCDEWFHNPAIKSNTTRLLSSEEDLKPNYSGVEHTSYDIVHCPCCGYTSLSSTFFKIKPNKAKKLYEHLKNRFNKTTFNKNITIEDAIKKFKLALYCCELKSAPSSEIGFVALKISWLYRSLENYYMADIATRLAYDKLTKAESEEFESYMGIRPEVNDYLLAELARRTGNTSDARRRVGRLIQNKNVSHNIKRRAENLKELLLEENKK